MDVNSFLQINLGTKYPKLNFHEWAFLYKKLCLSLKKKVVLSKILQICLYVPRNVKFEKKTKLNWGHTWLKIQGGSLIFFKGGGQHASNQFSILLINYLNFLNYYLNLC
jgi:hypothetical protein